MLQQLSQRRSPTEIPHQYENNCDFLLIKPTKLKKKLFCFRSEAAVLTFHCAHHQCYDLGQMGMPRTNFSFAVWVTDDRSV